MSYPFVNRTALLLGLFTFTAVAIFIKVPESRALLCSKWGEGEKMGTLDYHNLEEASGIAVSRRFPRRLYHVNDSGNWPYFYTTDMSGGNTKQVKISGYASGGSYFEDASLQPCFAGKTVFHR
jgi:hypothetical protein